MIDIHTLLSKEELRGIREVKEARKAIDSIAAAYGYMNEFSEENEQPRYRLETAFIHLLYYDVYSRLYSVTDLSIKSGKRRRRFIRREMSEIRELMKRIRKEASGRESLVTVTPEIVGRGRYLCFAGDGLAISSILVPLIRRDVLLPNNVIEMLKKRFWWALTSYGKWKGMDYRADPYETALNVYALLYCAGKYEPKPPSPQFYADGSGINRKQLIANLYFPKNLEKIRDADFDYKTGCPIDLLHSVLIAKNIL
jgi:hypothetical protein